MSVFSFIHCRSIARRWLAKLILSGMELWAAHSTFGAGAREFLIQNWTREDGLPGSTVTAIAQTPDGYLWVGTFGGLARFDGVRFQEIELRQLADLLDTRVFCLSTDQDGALWIGVGDGHLIRLSQGQLTSYLPPSRQTADRSLQSLVGDKDGVLWMLNHEGRLSYFEAGAIQGLSSDLDNVVALAADSTQGVWVAARNDLRMAEDGRLVRVWDASEEAGFKPELLAPARQGGCWVVSDRRVRRFQRGGPQETRTALLGKAVATTALVEDGEGSLWLASYGGGVSVFAPDGSTKRLTREQGLPSDLVRCLFEDREGNLWAGLEGRGLVRIGRAVFASYGEAEGLSGETVLCVCEGNPGEVWIGTNGDGVYRVANGETRHYGRSEGLTNQFVWAVHQDRTGVLWSGTWGGGLFRVDDDQFVSTSAELGPTPIVLALHEDVRGILWLGQRISDQRRIEAIEQHDHRSYAVPGQWPRIDVRAIAETPDGSLWFGTVDTGLLRRKDGVFTQCTPAHGLPPGSVSTLHVDDTGALWVGVVGVGIVLWENERFTPIKAAQSLLDDILNQITDDGLGHLWCGLRSGVVRLKKDHLRRLARGENQLLEWQRFTKSDGLPSTECSGSGCRTRDGRIWFATATGVAVVNPRHVAARPSPPPVLIEDVLLAGRPVRDRARATPAAFALRQDASNSPVPLAIPPGGGPLDIQYTALNFAAPTRVRFRYQMRGLDDSPVDVGGTRSVHYSHLPPGDYEFHVTARNEGGDWNATGNSFAFQVLPFYWQTAWFRALAIIAFTGAVAGTVGLAARRRHHRRIQHLESLHALERERARIAQDLHDDLGTSLTEINFLSGMAGSPSSSPEEARHSLESINEKSLELVKALDEIVWAVNPQNDSLGNLVNYLCLFAQEYLRPASIQCRLDVPTGLPDFALNAEQRHTLFLVTKEALANAAKHSAASELRLSVTLADSLLTIVLEDNGRGFERNSLKGDRNGLKNIETRMKHLGGRGTVHSQTGRGTRVELHLTLH